MTNLTALDEMREHYGPLIDRASLTPNHYKGCWKDHWACAVSRLLDECERLKAPNVPPTSNERVALLERIARLATELCVSVDKSAEDIGGERPALAILRDIGPLTDQLEKLGPEPAAGVGVTDLAGSSSRETTPPHVWRAVFECSECKDVHRVSAEKPYFKVMEFQCLRCEAITAADREMTDSSPKSGCSDPDDTPPHLRAQGYRSGKSS